MFGDDATSSFDGFLKGAGHEADPRTRDHMQTNRIAEICSKLACLTRQYSSLDESNDLHAAENEANRGLLYREICALEEELSLEKPNDAKDALKLALICAYRVNSVFSSSSKIEDFQQAREDAAAVDRILKAIIAVLEAISGVSSAALGLDWYLTPSEGNPDRAI
jgi:hypothetical protein